MAITNILLTDSLENFRVKSNTVFASVGELDTLTHGATTTFSGINGENEPGFGGVLAEFTISNVAGTYQIDSIDNSGTTYNVNDTITVPGSQLGGVDGPNDATITVTAVTPGFAIDGATITGTGAPQIVAELNLLRTEKTSLDTYLGNLTLPGTDTNLTDALATLRADIDSNDVDIADHETRVQSLEGLTGLTSGSLQTTAQNIVEAINEVNAIAEDAQAEIGGDVATAYNGTDTTIIGALNTHEAIQDALPTTYLALDGSNAMSGIVTVSDEGIDSVANNMLLKTAGTTRINISATNGNIGINKTPGTYKVDVSGTVNATALRYNGEDTDTRYLKAGAGDAGSQVVSVAATFENDVTFSNAVIIGSTTVASDTLSITEWTQDVAGNMFEGNSESGGISAVYNDTTGKITLAIANNSHNHTSANISDFAEAVQDTVDGMFTHQTTAFSYDDTLGRITLLPEFIQDTVGEMVNPTNTEAGINVTYDDATGKLNFDVNDYTVTLAGDVTGTVTVNNLGSYTINTTVANSSVATADIQDSAVTAAKIANNAVTNAKIADNAVTQAKLADDAVGSAELANVQTLVIYNSAGTAIKTLYGAGS